VPAPSGAGSSASGGVVDYVEEDLTKNSNPKAVKFADALTEGKVDLYVPGNELRIKHDDGSYSRYVHMVPGGVFPEKDDRVERGDQVIIVGKTGNATGPHLHWEWRNTADGPSLLTASSWRPRSRQVSRCSARSRTRTLGSPPTRSRPGSYAFVCPARALMRARRVRPRPPWRD
jgi:murein DD-endopeptidase MepM/ murein hydrolase activator NlpD